MNPLFSLPRLLFNAGLLALSGSVMAQPPASRSVSVPLTDLSAFQKTSANWRIVGDASASLTQANTLSTQPGTGVLANVPPAKFENGQPYNIQTVQEFGDIDLELDYMMAKGSNSGVYLQGRYEVQLLDSWGVRMPKAGDNGSIYERWDESRPEGSKGYEGHPARQNASRAPGLWQHLKISFQAPRFDASGKKTENAKIVRLELNGVLIHENVNLSGPTRGPIANNEKPTGPLFIQGDHGPVAFRNIQITTYGRPRPELTNLNYEVYKGKFEQEPAYGKLPPEAKGPTSDLSPFVTTLNNEFLVRYTGTLKVQEAGEYRFNLGVPGGGGVLRINNKPVIAKADWRGNGRVELPAGEMPFELIYSKFVDWAKPNIGLAVSGPGIREYSLTSPIADEESTDPIIVEAPTNTLLRSFMDLPGVPATGLMGQNNRGAYRVTHAVSVGSPEQVHYTYDLDNGSVVQVWRGTFLDTTPMWNDRGDGSSRPTGMVQRFGRPALMLAPLATDQVAWPTDTTGSRFRPKGYMLDDQDRPTFRYTSFGATVQDQLRVLDNSHGLRRELTVQNAATPLYARLVTGTAIRPLENGLYMVDGQVYVRIDNAEGAVPVVRSSNGKQELIVPVKSKLTYSILF
ncbi:DUF1080 domain-containing protein [Rudanella paleaurantiibacter]|uniref:DUF1080 domain-containing protein n=1 Tax=Rudanella paleaurantiibacter TaxID=2614655 RepID=A0A7J5U3T0_9BACT|nr:DUF1080 domain-containing protein [Rudanella paleaurantiibacter]KAB7732406.1 DUF1080 domain-containing protein [Rudanella paleaurantiibacter]